MDHLSYMQLCRLCLVKDKVNVPIFDDANDVRQIFLKITACLPVKVSRDDNLPKKICNECLYKIDSLYQFWNTTINAEKQLLQWLNEIGVDTTVTNAAAPLQQILPQSHAHPHTEEIILKEEALEDLKPEHNNIIFPSYIPNQQQPPPPNLTKFQPADEEEEDDPPRRRTRGRPAKKKAASVLEAALTAQDSDSVDSDRLADGGADDSDYVDEERVTKEEVDSDEDYVDPLEPTQFVNVSNDAEQPGPSGLNNTAKSTTTLQPPTHTDTGLVLVPGLLIIPVDEKLICTKCNRRFKNIHQLRNHKRRHAEPKHPCNMCDKKFLSNYELNLHRTIHSDHKEFACDLCDKRFRRIENMRTHRRRHVEQYTKTCKQCGKGFYSNKDLNDHILVHHKSFRFKCDECDSEFMQSGSVLAHKRSQHQGIRRVRKKQIPKRSDCKVCGKSVILLDEHMRVHTGERPYKCDECGKRFSKLSSLRRHELTHQDIRLHQCEVCKKTFTQRSPLVIHMRTHTGETPYKCTVCKEEFISRSQLNYHTKKTHTK